MIWQSRTGTQAGHSLDLLNEAIHLVHLVDCGLRPAILLHDLLGLFSEWLDVLRIGCEMVQDLREGLCKRMTLTVMNINCDCRDYEKESWTDHRGRVESCEIHRQDAQDEWTHGSGVAACGVYEPLQHVILLPEAMSISNIKDSTT